MGDLVTMDIEVADALVGDRVLGFYTSNHHVYHQIDHWSWDRTFVRCKTPDGKVLLNGMPTGDSGWPAGRISWIRVAREAPSYANSESAARLREFLEGLTR